MTRWPRCSFVMLRLMFLVLGNVYLAHAALFTTAMNITQNMHSIPKHGSCLVTDLLFALFLVHGERFFSVTCLCKQKFMRAKSNVLEFALSDLLSLYLKSSRMKFGVKGIVGVVQTKVPAKIYASMTSLSSSRPQESHTTSTQSASTSTTTSSTTTSAQAAHKRRILTAR